MLISDDKAAKVLIAHQRLDTGACLCGWNKWGASHAAHLWRMLRLAGAK